MKQQAIPSLKNLIQSSPSSSFSLSVQNRTSPHQKPRDDLRITKAPSASFLRNQSSAKPHPHPSTPLPPGYVATMGVPVAENLSLHSCKLSLWSDTFPFATAETRSSYICMGKSTSQPRFCCFCCCFAAANCLQIYKTIRMRLIVLRCRDDMIIRDKICERVHLGL